MTRRTQTYERDIAIGYDPFDRQRDGGQYESESEFIYEEEENAGWAKGLFANLIDNISDIPSSRGGLSDTSSDGIVAGKKKKKRRNGKFITRENFEMDDIMGDFELDDHGNIIFPVIPEQEIEEFKKKRGKDAVLLKDK